MRLRSRLPIAALLFGVAGITHAARPNQANKPDKPNRAARAEKSGRVAGTIVRIENGVLTLTTAARRNGAQEVVLRLNSATAIKINGLTAAPADLKPGMRIVVAATNGVASSVTVAPAKEKPKANAERQQKKAERAADRRKKNKP